MRQTPYGRKGYVLLHANRNTQLHDGTDSDAVLDGEKEPPSLECLQQNLIESWVISGFGQGDDHIPIGRDGK